MRLSARARAAAEQVCADLDSYGAVVAAVAVPRALNRLGEQAQTAGLRKISEVYSIGPTAFRKYVSTKPATTGDALFEITCKGKGLPMELFSPRQTKQGVSVLIKGKRILIPHAFIARMPNGHVGVFARGSYGGKGKNVASGETFGRFAFGRKRLAINELFTFSPPDAFGSDDVQQAMRDRVDEQAASVLAHEIEFAAK